MSTGNSIAVFYITARARETAMRVCELYPEAEAVRYGADMVESRWPHARALVFAMASGIAVRSIAPLVGDKATDPAVIVMDEAGTNVVSLLGGHEAGANSMAREIAEHLGGNPVITTATDSRGLSAIDVFASEMGLAIDNRFQLAATSMAHIESGGLSVYTDIAIRLPEDYECIAEPARADVIISARVMGHNALYLRPGTLVLGIGMNSGTTAHEARTVVMDTLRAHGLSPLSIKCVATHEAKMKEAGLRELARELGVRLYGLATEELNTVEGVAESEAAMKALGVRAVAEPAALLVARADGLLVEKVRSGNVTLAVAEAAYAGRVLYVVGTGPGGLDRMTPEAMRAIRNADAVVGYRTYLEQIEPLTHGKEIVASAMTEEVVRCRAAVEEALKGRRVAMISGGDPGVYGMAGLVLEIVRSMGADMDVKVIPGISALNACASVIGAPLMHDFAAVSLSDRLTPWKVIEKRLRAAAEADFVIALYNPKSRGRKTQIERAREIIMEHRPADTPVGIVKAATRPDEEAVVTTLGRMLDYEIGMQSTLIIGNSMSFRHLGMMVTPRGYGSKYEL